MASRKDFNSKNEIIDFVPVKELNRRIQDYKSNTLTIGDKIDEMAVSDLVTFLTKPVQTGPVNLFEYFEAKIASFKHTKSEQTCNGYTTALERFKLFVNKHSLYADNFQ